MDIRYENLTTSQQWILKDAYESGGEPIRVSMKGTNSDHEQMVDMGLLKRVMLQSGFNPVFGYICTAKGTHVVNQKDNLTEPAELTALRAQLAESERQLALTERDFAPLRERYGLLLEFVERVADQSNANSGHFTDKECVFAYLDFKREARELLAKLGIEVDQ